MMNSVTRYAALAALPLIACAQVSSAAVAQPAGTTTTEDTAPDTTAPETTRQGDGTLDDGMTPTTGDAATPGTTTDPATGDTATTTPAPATAPGTATAGAASTYRCDNNVKVAVRYDNSDAAAPKAMVTVDGTEYAMVGQALPDGQRFATDKGPTAGTYLNWQTKGQDALLYEIPTAGAKAEGDLKVKATCKMADAPAG